MNGIEFEAERAKQHRLQMAREEEESNPLFAAAVLLACIALAVFILGARWLYVAVIGL